MASGDVTWIFGFRTPFPFIGNILCIYVIWSMMNYSNDNYNFERLKKFFFLLNNILNHQWNRSRHMDCAHCSDFLFEWSKYACGSILSIPVLWMIIQSSRFFLFMCMCERIHFRPRHHKWSFFKLNLFSVVYEYQSENYYHFIR